MKKLLLLLLIVTTTSAFADQLSYLSKSQADSAVVILKQQPQILLWCACCEQDTKTIISLNDIDVKYTGTGQFYQIFITGVDSKGKSQNNEIDLAYVYIIKGDKWFCLGKEMGLKCDPCAKPFIYSL